MANFTRWDCGIGPSCTIQDCLLIDDRPPANTLWYMNPRIAKMYLRDEPYLQRQVWFIPLADEHGVWR